MPAYSKERQKYQQSRIRSIMILRPDATLEQIQDALQASTDAPIELTLTYIGKLRNKIFRERTRRNENLNKGARIAYIQDKKRVIEQLLWQEASNRLNPGVVRVMALEKIMKHELELLKAEMDAGFYERTLGKLELATKVEHEHTLAPELLGPIMRALKNYGLVKPKLIEPEHATTNTSNPEPGGGDPASANPAPAAGAAPTVPGL